ncbi:glycosyltransferase [Alkalibacter mobilis]|uniref:glycosyltransferase n=1 Tax=Alkalibacter mobilis TaxID=2787712 RepID=UPI00189F8FBF|nr:glycosyltransferase [Alkalibacter mobilis]MBF7096123.1 glycosyltransferase [Alkalibacter mobilis]
MKIMILARGIPTNKSKTYGIFEFDQAKALHKAGVDVIYAAVDIRSIRHWRKWGLSKKVIDGIKVYTINIPGGNLPGTMVRFLRRYGFEKLFRHIQKHEGTPDLIHSHFYYMSRSAGALCRELKIPLVITEHSSKLNMDVVDGSVKDEAIEAYSLADRLIAVSPAIGDSIKKHLGIDPLIISNVVDTEEFKVSENQNEDMFTVVSTGNLIPQKQMDMLIRAFGKVFSSEKQAKLIIFGDGPEKDKLLKITRELGLENMIELKGIRERSEIASALQRANLFALASKSETFGVSYIEALASGVPVIATRCGGPEYFVNEQNGILIEPDDFEGLVSALELMKFHSNDYDRSKIAKEIDERFSSKAVASRLIELYKDII